MVDRCILQNVLSQAEFEAARSGIKLTVVGPY